jgi:hypothetical protein
MCSRRLRFVVTALLAAACGAKAPAPAGPTPVGGIDTLVFRAALVDPAEVDFILPLGNLNPPGHTLPTDHIYFYIGFTRREIRGVPVMAPGDGTIQTILRRSGGDARLFVRVNNTFSYYVDHVVIDADIREGSPLTAGQRLGTSSLGGFGVDLGVLNASRALTFITPGRYSGDTLNADAPLKYYEEPVRSQLYALVRRDGADRDGKIDFDVAGTLAGNWFHESLPVGESTQPSGWTRHLAFVYDNVQPSLPCISIGGTLSLAGVFAVNPSDLPFDRVRPESGLVMFALRSGGVLGTPVGEVVGTLLVQMLDASRIRVETFAGPVPPAGFTSAAQIYLR